jgi:hypothetical protein
MNDYVKLQILLDIVTVNNYSCYLKQRDINIGFMNKMNKSIFDKFINGYTIFTILIGSIIIVVLFPIGLIISGILCILEVVITNMINKDV